MKPKKDELFLTAAFCGFLAIMLALFLLLPKERFSETEKRYLEQFPDISWDSIVSGQFSQDLERYMADHMPGRTFFVGLNAYAQLLSGQQPAQEIYLTQSGALVEAPTAWSDAAVHRNMAAIQRFSQYVEGTLSMMIVPSAGWLLEDSIAHPAAPYSDPAFIEKIYAMAPDGTKTIDLAALYLAQEDPQNLFYRTDHHWTSYGANLAYEAFCSASGLTSTARENFTVETHQDFRGSTYSRSGLWLTKGEPIQLWKGASLTVSNADVPGTQNSPFYVSRLEESDKYTVFLDGNHSLVRLYNPAGTGKLLVVRDSFANCLGSFLAENYEEVILVDLRYYKTPVSELLRQEEIEDALICYSLSNFMTDANLVWLR